MLIVHHLEQSRSQRIVWLLEDLKLPYELKLYKRNPATMLAPPELRKVHPLGKAPILEDDGTILIESGAIIDYLISRHGSGSGLRPVEGTQEHLDYMTFLHFAEGSMMPPLLLRLISQRMSTGAPALLRPLVRTILAPLENGFIAPNIKRTLDFLEAELARRPWFGGLSFSGADIQMSFPLEMAQQRGGLDKRWPKLMDFLGRIRAMPAYQRARIKIGEG